MTSESRWSRSHLQSWPGAARLRSLTRSSVELSYGRDVIERWAANLEGRADPAVLDVGLGRGADLRAVADVLAPARVRLHGVDADAARVGDATAQGIDAHVVDLEREPLPWADHSFDLVIANQVLEHLKEIFWVISEAHRTLKPGGLFLVGVPNLASLHNRILLAAGEQPSAIELLGPHVRGYTPRALRRLLEWGGAFTVVSTAGANFYPLPPRTARAMARLWPGGAVSSFALARRNETGAPYAAAIRPDMVIGTGFRLQAG